MSHLTYDESTIFKKKHNKQNKNKEDWLIHTYKSV